MSAKILDGKSIAGELLKKIRQRVQQRIQRGLHAPGLAVIQVGNDPASQIYVRNKRWACDEAGIQSFSHDLPETISQADLLDLIDQLNKDPQVNGTLVQLPIPKHINSETVIEHIRPDKDVDGFHPYNMGRLILRNPQLRPCTPMGVMMLLETTGLYLKEQDAVVVGASNHVGRPMAMELLSAGCTVSMCHRFTKDLKIHVKQADILVVCVGKPNLIKGEWIKPGAAVIDIGFTRTAEGQLVGDVDFEAACQRAGWITPVPGGVGPMTVAHLLQNTLYAADNLHA